MPLAVVRCSRAPHQANENCGKSLRSWLGASFSNFRDSINAECFVFACGARLAKLFPHVLGPCLYPTRQEVFFFAVPPGDQYRSNAGAAFIGQLRRSREKTTGGEV